MNTTQAFARYGARPKNVQWAFSAVATDGALVISCWQHRLKTRPGHGFRYEDLLARVEHNSNGHNLLEEHLRAAYADGRPVRLVIAIADDPAAVERGENASKIKKTIAVREDVVGRVVDFDGNNYAIDFEPKRVGTPSHA